MNVKVRPAAVAGMFYPESAEVLRREIAQMLNEVSGSPSDRPKAIIAPHAGYIYSGPIAASVFARLTWLRSTVRRIVLLGPTHRVAIDGLAVPSSNQFVTPLGSIPIDQQAIAAIMDLPQVVVSDAAHAQEHSLEVELPFLQAVFGEFSLLPLAVGQTTPLAVAEVIERVWGGDETLIVVSSDLSHYLPYADARRVDAQTAQRIVNLDATVQPMQACGALPVNGLLLAARKHGLQAELVDLRNSGDTAGDKARVVGYGAFAFHESARHAH
jgi:hypothetical protein